MRRFRLSSIFTLLIGLSVLASGCGEKTPSAPDPVQTTRIDGVLYGTTMVPRDSIPADARPEMVWELDHWYDLGAGRVKVSLMHGGTMYEFRRTYPTDSLTVEIGGTPVSLSPDGSFSASAVPVGRQPVVFKLRHMEVRRDTMDVRPAATPLALDIDYDPMVCGHHDMTKANPTTFPCLDNNGIGPRGFTFSDCFMSLFFSPCTWYTWMCWSEAMDRIHDHHGNIWCDGSHNCSLFVHAWDWNKQSWHRHYGPWWPRC